MYVHQRFDWRSFGSGYVVLVAPPPLMIFVLLFEIWISNQSDDDDDDGDGTDVVCLC